MNINQQMNNQPIVLLKATEVAVRLNVSRSLAYTLMRKGIIPTIRIQRTIRVRPIDLEEYIQKSWSGWS
jgi:excisionase family DNA binding protein